MTALRSAKYADVADRLSKSNNFYRAVVTKSETYPHPEKKDVALGWYVTTPFGTYYMSNDTGDLRAPQENDIIVLYGRRTSTIIWAAVNEMDNTVYFFNEGHYNFDAEHGDLEVPIRKTVKDIPLEVKKDYEDWTLTSVEESKNKQGEITGWMLGSRGCGIFCQKPTTHEVPTPKIGDVMRLYTRGLGHRVNGFSLGDVVYRCETDEEMHNDALLDIINKNKQKEIELQEKLPKLDERFNKLPPEMQARIAKFRRNNPTFRRDFEEMELSLSEQALAISAFLKKDIDKLVAVAAHLVPSKKNKKAKPPLTRDEIIGKLANDFYNRDFAEQKAMVPEIDAGHSGNSFGCLMKLAYTYTTKPENTVNVRGFLTPLVGAVEYGDLTQEEYDALKEKEAALKAMKDQENS